MGEKEDSALKSQSVFNSLVRAVRNGAIGAQYSEESGGVVYSDPIVDKDQFEVYLTGYAQVLRAAHVPKKQVKEKVETLRENFFSGTADQQNEILGNLSMIVNEPPKG